MAKPKRFDLAGVRNRVVELRMMKPCDLLDHPGQWRNHMDAQVEAMVGVLRENGINDPLKAWISERAGGKVVTWDGHLRKALDPNIEWPVIITDYNDAEADYALLTHDPLGAMAVADKAALDALLASVQTSDAAVQTMLADLAKDSGLDYGKVEDADAEPQIDRAEALREKWGVELGSLWRIGDHRLLCGDSTKREDVARVMGEGKPTLMVTDPPYGVEYDANWRNEAAAEGKLSYAASRIGQVENDDRVDWSDAWRLFTGDVMYTWSPGGDHVVLTGLAIQSVGFEIRNQIIWHKPHFPISRGHYTYQHEPC